MAVSAVGDRKRNMNIEILRVFSMFLVVVCHYFASNYRFADLEGFAHILKYWIDKLAGQTGVCCFLMITGYFMVGKSFKVARVIKTDIQAVVYSVILCVCYCVLMVTQAFPDSVIPRWHALPEATTFFQSIFPVWNSVYWFVTAYVFLLIISPVLNLIISHLNARWHMLVIIVFSSVSIWQLFSKFSAYWNYLLYAAIVYMIGAWIRLYADRIRMSHKYLKITGVIVISALLLFLFSVEIVSNGAIADWFNWSGHTMFGGVPVLPMVIAACIFYAVLQLPVRAGGPGLMRVSSLIAPAMFGVYLLHGNQTFFVAFWYAVNLCIPSVEGPAMIAIHAVAIVALFIVLTLLSVIINAVLVTPITRLIMRSSAVRRISHAIDDVWNF